MGVMVSGNGWMGMSADGDCWGQIPVPVQLSTLQYTGTALVNSQSRRLGHSVKNQPLKQLSMIWQLPLNYYTR